jgi:hypothetical protein
MDPGESTSITDLVSAEVQLRIDLGRVQDAFFRTPYPTRISQTLGVMPDVVGHLLSLHGVIQSHLGQLANDGRSAPKRTIFVDLREKTDQACRSAADVRDAASLAAGADKVRATESRIQTLPELREERNAAEPWEAALIAELEAIIDALQRINKEFPLGQADLPGPESGGGATASSQPSFDSRRYDSPQFVT